MGRDKSGIKQAMHAEAMFAIQTVGRNRLLRGMSTDGRSQGPSHDHAKKIGEILRLWTRAISQDAYVDGIEMDGD